MLLPFRPTSNTERQRQFRERNPGYYGRLHRRQKAEIDARLAAKALAAAEVAVTVTRREPLMLLAPVEMIEIPGMNVIPAVPFDFAHDRPFDFAHDRLQAPAAEPVRVTRKIEIPFAFASFFAD
jgi:hypothetical protein